MVVVTEKVDSGGMKGDGGCRRINNEGKCKTKNISGGRK